MRIYSYGTDLIGQDRRDPTTGAWTYSYYGYDGHGSVRELFDEAGHVTDTYTYDAFGILVERAGATPNHYRYAGEQFDEDLGLSYNRARYLNLATGRFWSMDEYEGRSGEPATLHKYLYAHADPVNGYDPNGYMTLGSMMQSTAIQGTLRAMSQPNVIRAIAQAKKLCNIITTVMEVSDVIDAVEGIYVVVSTVTGNLYVGSSIDMGTRLGNHSNKDVKKLIDEGAEVFAFKANIPDSVTGDERKRMLRVLEQNFLDEMTDGQGLKKDGVLNKIRPRSLKKYTHALANGCKSVKAK